MTWFVWNAEKDSTMFFSRENLHFQNLDELFEGLDD